MQAVDVRKLKADDSIVQDKVATPSEPARALHVWEQTERPQYLLAEQSSKSSTDMHEEYKHLFAEHGTVDIQTGNVFLPQFKPQYLGMTHPYALPIAVGGYDIVGEPRWRRQELELHALQDFSPGTFADGQVGMVRLFDVARGLPQRIEGQYRRNWSLAPALWNLYFRERVNLGASLTVREQVQQGDVSNPLDTDYAQGAAGAYKLLDTGTYRTISGKRCKIDGDISKLPFAEGVTPIQKKLFANMRFRCAQIPGTQEIRSKIGHVGTWASVVYGNGIFMTVSPGERHNYLAIRLCRYRGGDPFVACDTDSARAQRPFIGADQPSLEPAVDELFGFEVPGYELRRLMQAHDPLCAVNAFFVQIRVILAECLGIRMCPDCPHCVYSDNPCQDSFGSVAELMGGMSGRIDALFGATECQKSNGSLHFHFFAFGQRLHQFANLMEIAEKLERGFVRAEELKNYLNEVCCTEYPDVKKFEAEQALLESHFPTYTEKQETSTADGQNFMECHLGHIPRFVRNDASSTQVPRKRKSRGLLRKRKSCGRDRSRRHQPDYPTVIDVSYIIRNRRKAKRPGSMCVTVAVILSDIRSKP